MDRLPLMRLVVFEAFRLGDIPPPDAPYLWHFYSFGNAELLGSFFILLSRRTIFKAKATSRVPLISIIKLEEKKEARNSLGWLIL